MPDKLEQIRNEARTLSSGIHDALCVTRRPDSFELARLEALKEKTDALCKRLGAIEPSDSREAAEIIKPLLTQLEEAAFLLQDSVELFQSKLKGSSQ